MWCDKLTKAQVFTQAGLPNMHTLLTQPSMRWYGYVQWMEDSLISMDILYGEQASGKRSVGSPPVALHKSLQVRCESSGQ